MHPEFTIATVDAGDIRAKAADWVDLYNDCFTSPPWNEPKCSTTAEFLRRIGWHLDQPGLHGLEARDEHGRVVGVCYGWPSSPEPPDKPFYRGLTSALGAAELRKLWDTRPFEVVELMIDPGTRGGGLGRLLLERVRAGFDVAWLATSPEAPAAGWYRRLGWRHAGSFHAGVDLELFVHP